MIETQSDLTLSLALAAGLYFLAGGLTGFLARDKWGAILKDFAASPALTYITGVFVFVLGVAIILAHNIWTDPLAGLISLIGWIAAAEGLILIVSPEPLLKWSQSLLRPRFISAFAGFTMLLGAVLVVIGITGIAG